MATEPKWTAQQRQAIDAAAAEVLVSAGAGSGKTAVLVERVLRRILDPKAPVDLERILVVTFTEEAADEMRRRIRSAIQERLAQDAPNPRLARQLAFLERAQISTIHAFCLRLLRENFHRVGLDPQAETLEEEEARLLTLETLDAVFEERYGAQGEAGRAFADLAERYGGPQGDRALRAAVLSLHEMLETVLDPDQWLEKATRAYREPDSWLEAWRARLAMEIESLLSAFRSALRQLADSRMPQNYLEIVREDTSRLEAILKDLRSAPLDEAFEGFAGWELGNLPAGRQTPEQKSASAAFRAARDRLKKMLPLASAFQPEAARASAARLAPHAEALCALAADFRSAYAEAKSRQGVLDFHDLERFALRLLRDEDGSPSPTALAQRGRFEHVVIDEYQDINPLQEAILSRVAREEPSNRFMVGDVKQCIYGFRHAEPGIFLEKLKTHSGGPGASRLAVNLTANFRSRPEILDAVNALFGRIFTPSLGGLSYGADEALRPGLDFGDSPAGAGVAELLLLDSGKSAEDEAPDDPQALEALQADLSASEAREIGRRILAWTGADGRRPMEIRDGETGRARPAGYGDVAILLRTMRERAARFAEALRAMGIPVAMSAETAFFESTEVLDTLSLLRLLDNPRQDIPLAAALRSPLAGLSETDLAEIRISMREGAFHEAARALAGSDSGSPLSKRLGAFYADLERWRTAARSKPLADLLRQIYAETGYFDYVGGLSGGAHRQARLEGLIERARRFGAFRRPTLFRFLRFIEDLAEREILLKAPPPPPSGDSVRVLSIHQSKGLEFPIVFVADLAKQFNFQDARGDLLLDRREGIGLSQIVLERGERRPTLMNRVVASAQEDRTRAEEARLLYVAMTRARDRLVLSATVDFDKRFKGRGAAPRNWTAAAGRREKPLAPDVLRSANSAIGWIGPALAALPEGQAFCASQAGQFDLPEARFRVTLAQAAEAAQDEPALARKEGRQGEPAWLEALRQGRPLCADWRAEPVAVHASERLAWRYPDLRLAELPAKVSVSEFKSRLERPAEDDEEIRAAFLPREDTDRLRAAQRGSLLHAILQRLDLAAAALDETEIARQARAMAEQGFIAPEDLARLDLRPLASFFASERGRWLAARRESLRREAPFCMRLPASVLAPDLETARARGEPLIVQGVIDALVETAEGFWLLDYKTDAIGAEAAAARAQAYLPQMALYAQAVHNILRRRPAGASLIFLIPGVAHDFHVEALLAWPPQQAS